MTMTKSLVWENKYSVGVAELDNQHKRMFATINELIDLLGNKPTNEALLLIVESLVQYKKFHFATEENYFKQFNYAGADEHINEHKMFNEKLEILKSEFGGDPIQFSYELVDFLEDWLIHHLMTTDHKYISCFKEHGLK
jgi:hemerythrin